MADQRPGPEVHYGRGEEIKMAWRGEGADGQASVCERVRSGRDLRSSGSGWVELPQVRVDV